MFVDCNTKPVNGSQLFSQISYAIGQRFYPPSSSQDYHDLHLDKYSQNYCQQSILKKSFHIKPMPIIQWQYPPIECGGVQVPHTGVPFGSWTQRARAFVLFFCIQFLPMLKQINCYHHRCYLLHPPPQCRLQPVHIQEGVSAADGIGCLG